MADFFEIRMVSGDQTVSIRKDGIELTRERYWEICQDMECALFSTRPDSDSDSKD